MVDKEQLILSYIAAAYVLAESIKQRRIEYLLGSSALKDDEATIFAENIIEILQPAFDLYLTLDEREKMAEAMDAILESAQLHHAYETYLDRPEFLGRLRSALGVIGGELR